MHFAKTLAMAANNHLLHKQTNTNTCVLLYLVRTQQRVDGASSTDMQLQAQASQHPASQQLPTHLHSLPCRVSARTSIIAPLPTRRHEWVGRWHNHEMREPKHRRATLAKAQPHAETRAPRTDHNRADQNKQNRSAAALHLATHRSLPWRRGRRRRRPEPSRAPPPTLARGRRRPLPPARQTDRQTQCTGRAFTPVVADTHIDRHADPNHLVDRLPHL
jgi:hypothetical protein